jgi:hypothetical protein
LGVQHVLTHQGEERLSVRDVLTQVSGMS